MAKRIPTKLTPNLKEILADEQIMDAVRRNAPFVTAHTMSTQLGITSKELAIICAPQHANIDIFYKRTETPIPQKMQHFRTGVPIGFELHSWAGGTTMTAKGDAPGINSVTWHCGDADDGEDLTDEETDTREGIEA